MEINILVADDDPIFLELVCDIIRKEGFNPIEAADGQQAVDAFFSSNNIDVLILDVMMPKLDGWQVLEEIRTFSDVPVIMLTALGDERHEVLGFQQGADDYIAKPFSYQVFVARLNHIIRKIKKEKLSTLTLGDLVIDQARRSVAVRGADIDLNNKEYHLLLYFARNRGLVLTREMILNRVWGYDFEGDIRTIDTHIKTLRSKLGPYGSYIKTVRGSGYILRVENDEDH